MIDIKTLDPNTLSVNKRLICQEILNRGWHAWLYHPKSSIIRVQRADGRIVEIFSATPPTTSFVAGQKADNKYVTTVLYKEAGLPVPLTYVAVSTRDIEAAAKELFNQGLKVVIKPLNSAHGHGIRVAISSLEEVNSAIKHAKTYSNSLVLQEHIENAVDLRLTCINYRFMAGLIRMPARVKGDGQRTIKELIEIENQNPGRGEKYLKPLNVIDTQAAEVYLGEKIKSIPTNGEYISVLGTANVGTGGETIDVSHKLPTWLIEMTEKAARLSDLPVCGVDFLVQKEPESVLEPKDLNAKLIEINKSPAIFLHETPTFGQARPVVKAYVDYLATL